MTAERPLTENEQAMLSRIIREGKVVYNDRARRSLEKMERLGLVRVEWNMRAQAKGNGIELVGCNTVRPSQATSSE